MELGPTMDNTEELPLELVKALEKADRINERAIRQAGYGSSDLGLCITKGYLETVADFIAEDLKVHTTNSAFNEPKVVIGQLDPARIALCALNTILHGVATEQPLTVMCSTLGSNISAECWSAGLLKHDKKLAERVERVARKRYHNVEYRRQAARSIAVRAGYTLPHWSNDRRVHAGNWLVDCVVQACPDLFELIQKPDDTYALTLAPNAREKAERAVGEVIARNPVSLPTLVPPHHWTSFKMAHVDPRVCYEVTFVRTFHKDVQAACKEAIADGSMKPALDAVSALQAVPWRINKRLYGVIRGVMERGIEVEGMPSQKDIPVPPKPTPWETATEQERTLWKIERDESEKDNRSERSARLLLAEDMQIAERLLDADRFYTAMNCDWRGRVNALPHFSFQREDRVRALFEFADGMPIGDEGLRYLQQHVANTGDFDKMSKQPIEDRIQWTIKNTPRIQEMVEVPLKDLWWTEADKPFLFLAACMELNAALRSGPSYVTRLPVSFDGSCSGLQHLSCMTRDEETAALVNLRAGAECNDVYSVIADAVIERLKHDTDVLAEKTLAYLGDDKKKQRKLAKRNVMTYSYSSKQYGMAGQQQTDLMDDLKKDVLRKKLPEHPFEPSYKGSTEKPSRAARFIAAHVYNAIEERIRLPARAMKFLQSLAKALAHEGKPLSWKTPTGMPWINRYHDTQVTRLQLWMHDRGVRFPIRSRVAVGNDPKINKKDAANGVAPNFVHSLDASHLQLTVNRSVAAGIHSIATVHDSFGCLAPQATTFNKIIREELIDMYTTHDVLAEIRECALRDLTQHNQNRIPDVPENGNFKLGEISDAQCTFA